MNVFLIAEGENFSNGWCILPVLTGKETELKEAFENGHRDYPDMALYSGGRYRYAGAKLTGLYPVLEVDLPVAGEYVIWTRSKYYASQDKGTYIVQIDSWQSTEFGSHAESQSDSWEWQKDRFRIEKPGVKTITLIDTRPEACCDVLVMTTDLDYEPRGKDLLIPENKRQHEITRVPYQENK